MAINGMGRIGRTLFRLLYEKSSIGSLIAVNDIMPKDNLIYLLTHDSIRGSFRGKIISTPNGFDVDGHEIFYHHVSHPAELPWQKHGIQTVVEATGLFTHSSEASQHLSGGAGRVLLTTYSKDVPSAIWGVNHLETSHDTKIISPGDCTVNCIAPLIHLVQERFGIHSVHVNVIQAYTTRQQLLDGPYKGFRRGRAAAHAIVPFEVNIKPVLEDLFPILKNKIESLSTRVPVPCGALADVSFFLQKETTSEAVASVILNASRETLQKIISITSDPIVSSDILGDPHSGTVDGSLIRVTNGNHLKLLAWFDNEWGYVNRLLDWLRFLDT